MSRFSILDTPIADLKIVERQQLGDSRGFLSRLFCADELAAAGWHKPIIQINQTLTQKQRILPAPWGILSLSLSGFGIRMPRCLRRDASFTKH